MVKEKTKIEQKKKQRKQNHKIATNNETKLKLYFFPICKLCVKNDVRITGKKIITNKMNVIGDCCLK